MDRTNLGKPPLTGTALQMQLAEERGGMKTKLQLVSLRQILNDLVVDGNVERAIAYIYELFGMPDTARMERLVADLTRLGDEMETNERFGSKGA